MSDTENKIKILVFNIFQRILNYMPSSIKKNFDEWHFKFRMGYKNPFSFTMTIKLSPYHNLLIQFNGGHPTINHLKNKIKEIELKLKNFVITNPILNQEIFNLLTSWVISQIIDRVFYFSRQIWLDEDDSPLEREDIKEKCNLFNILSAFPCSISRIWFYLLFEDIIPRLLNWINKFEISLFEQYKLDDSIKECYNLLANYGYPILINDTDLIFIRHFQYEEANNFEKMEGYDSETRRISISFPEWYYEISKKIDEMGYILRQTNFSTFNHFRNKPDLYPRYHCIIFSKICFYLFGEYDYLNNL